MGSDPHAAERTLQTILKLEPDHAEARHNLNLLRRQLATAT